ncbi:hypothetical protein [Streptomyces sp. CL7]|uniref:hypothetical protein n=1 Tax=Streptomyces sp. CL7 TaxID=3096006 RepID=UPI002A7630FD|nr:hypothetical protein [Streptomyces sp. CL7]WPP30020.1 hypothetical protein SJH97_12040 [Streptomyces sp. CL7]
MGGQPPPGADELRARHYLHHLDAHPFGHQPAVPPAPTPPEDPAMLLAIALAGLAPGLATAWLLRHRGWPVALAAGLGVTASLPFLLVAAMVAFPPLGLAVALASIAAVLHAYDDGRVLAGTAWALSAAISLTCAGVAL